MMRKYLNYYLDNFLHQLLDAFFIGLLPILLFGAVVGFFVLFRYKEIQGSDRRLIYAFSFVGAACGIMVGASRSNVVAAFLPALLTFVTSFLAYSYVSKDGPIEKLLSIIDKGSQTEKENLQEVISLLKGKVAVMGERQYLPLGIIALVISSVVSSFFGASVRSQSEAEDFAREKQLIEIKEIQVPLERMRLEAMMKSGLREKYGEEIINDR